MTVLPQTAQPDSLSLDTATGSIFLAAPGQKPPQAVTDQGRYCQDCQADISDRHGTARYCLDCQRHKKRIRDRARRRTPASRELQRGYNRQYHSSPEYLEKRRERDRTRAASTTNRDPATIPANRRCKKCQARAGDNPGLRWIDYLGPAGSVVWVCWPHCYDAVCQEVMTG